MMLSTRWVLRIFSFVLIGGLAGCGSEPTLVNGGQGSSLAQARSVSLGDVESDLPSEVRAFATSKATVETLAAASTSRDIDLFFATAEKNYPSLFPAGVSTQSLEGFMVRAYPGGVYLGIRNDLAYLLHPSITSGQILELGPVKSFLPAPIGEVKDILVDRLSYGQVSVFQLVGENLQPSALNVNISEGICTDAVTLATSTQAVYIACTVQSTGAIVLSAQQSGGKAFSKSFSTPVPRVLMTTNFGTLVFELSPSQAPSTVTNFLRYVNAGFYNQTLIHRLNPQAGQLPIAQGGLLTTTKEQKAPLFGPIPLESNKGLSNLAGTIAMARTAIPDSATSQFYINLADNPGLDFQSEQSPGYAVFGRVVQGQQVLNLFRAISTKTEGAFQDFPSVDFVVRGVTQIQ
jgi:cyclophilin family peptidyl-prolyl cis-trans isomerase